MRARPGLACCWLGVLGLLMLGQAQADLHRCTAADGSVSYRDTPCEASEASQVEAMPGNGKALSADLREAVNLSGFHPSWFEGPRHLVQRVQCSASACACGHQREVIQTDTVVSVLNAMMSLPSDWRAHGAAAKRWDELGARQSTFPAVRGEVERMACRVALRQMIVARWYPTVAPLVIEGHEQREQRLAEIDARCKRPEETGWTQSEAAKEWVRCLDRNRSEHNEAVRSRRQTSGIYDSLLEAAEDLRKPRPRS
ncbi:hypothetical protein [Pseudomarimonas arenosa]|uniref:DUF4124 domain-containing protein n=1 Tax=Pseudomarimonas arenosa TaxID=2774145 RepID=A0AAW3ZNE3_9GAMM|nr:hypothetical protein [Pseudomarimonas arenosa]MBD8527655.1 hypothetical protein [Pseudomarimonas arenosa]